MMSNYKKYAEYKDSGVDWLGEVPEHWKITPLNSISKLKSISNCIDKELLSVYLDKGVIRFNDVEATRTNVTSLDLSKYQLVEIGDLVLNNQQAWRGSVGVSQFEGIVSPAYIVLSLNKNLIDPIYANFLFRSSIGVYQYVIGSRGVGTIQRNLYYQHLKNAIFIFPPLHEQHLIANFLDRKTADIDKAISQKEQMIELLNERKQIVINNAVTRGLNPDVKLKDSGIDWIGEIPEHWEVRKLKYLARILNGKECDKQTEGKYPVYGSGGIFGWYDDYLHEGPTVLLGRKGTIDKPQLVYGPFWSVDTAFYTDINKDIISIEFFYYLCTIVRFDFYSSKTALPSMTQTDLYNIEFGIPTLSEQQEISNYIEQQTTKIDTTITQTEQEISLLKEYKASLIDSAVRGKICLV